MAKKLKTPTIPDAPLRLSETQRAILLDLLRGSSIVDAGARLGLTANAVGMHVLRARNKNKIGKKVPSIFELVARQAAEIVRAEMAETDG